MTVKELKETYGGGMLLNNLKRSGFNSFNTIEETVYKGVQVRVEYDHYNNRWLYSSDEVILSGRFVGTISELKTYLKSKIKEIVNS